MLVPREQASGERRVAATPETVRRLHTHGIQLRIEEGAGLASGYLDADYREAGAGLVASDQLPWDGVDGVLCLNPPATAALQQLRPGALLVGLLSPYGAHELVQVLCERRTAALALELLPRISRAQSMDVLSSQANIAGYKAVLLASAALDRYVPC